MQKNNPTRYKDRYKNDAGNEDPHCRSFIQAQQCWYLPTWTLCGEVERASSATLWWLCQTAPVALSSPAPRRRRYLYLKISEIEKKC